MIRPLRLLVPLALLMPAALPLTAQESLAKVDPKDSAVPALSLEECVARALGKNFDLQIQQFATQNAKDAITIAGAVYDPNLQASAATSGSKAISQNATLDESGNLVVCPSARSTFTDFRLGVSQRIVTGAVASVTSNLGRSKRTPASSRLNPAYDADVTLSVTQPLLRGEGIAVNRNAIERAKIGLVRANYDFQDVRALRGPRRRRGLLQPRDSREQLTVRRFSLGVAERLLEENRARRNTGVSTDLDVLQAEVGVANARRNLILAEQEVREREDDLLNLIGQFEFNATLGDVN